MAKTLALDLKKSKENNDGSLSPQDYKKITTYYGLTVPIIGEAYCLLRGENISLQERHSLTYLGAITGLFDDFFDEKSTPENHIKKLINTPSLDICQNAHEHLFITLYLKGLKHHNIPEIKRVFNLINEAQTLSKEQTTPTLSQARIQYITKQKGGISFLYYRLALDGEITNDENHLLFHIGLLAQLENDIFDIYKDTQEGIHTLATTSQSIDQLRQYYQNTLDEIHKLITRTHFSTKNKKKFAQGLSIIATRAFVCLDQLKELETDGVFKLKQYNRQQLICDMGKFANIYNWLIYFLK